MSVQEQKADAVMIVLLEGEHQALCESCSAACHCLDLLSEYRHWRNCVCNTIHAYVVPTTPLCSLE